MAMSTRETQVLNLVMRWVLRLPSDGKYVTSDDARREAMWLMDRASRALGAGLRADDVAEHWPAADPREPAADLAFVVQAIEAWQDGGTAPHDVLIAIRDQLAGRTPGEEAP